MRLKRKMILGVLILVILGTGACVNEKRVIEGTNKLKNKIMENGFIPNRKIERPEKSDKSGKAMESQNIIWCLDIE